MDKANPLLSIAQVSRETGLEKDVLRVWEKRYGFPAPMRDAQGDRLYSGDQVNKLRLLRRLIDDGHRPGKIISLTLAELMALSESHKSAHSVAPSAEMTQFLALVRNHQIDELRASLAAHMLKLGLESFIMEIAAPLCAMIGEAWASGELQIFEEHLFTEELTRILRATLQGLARSARSGTQKTVGPRILLTTLPGEPHALGLLMVESMLAAHGCDCLSLGPQTPQADIVQAAQAQRVNVVALSFSSWFTAAHVAPAIETLAAQLPADIALWVGGSNPALTKNALPAHVISGLGAIGETVRDWRARIS